MQDAEQIVAMRETFIGMEHRLSAALEQRQQESVEKLRAEFRQLLDAQPRKPARKTLYSVLLNFILPALIWAAVIYTVYRNQHGLP